MQNFIPANTTMFFSQSLLVTASFSFCRGSLCCRIEHYPNSWLLPPVMSEGVSDPLKIVQPEPFFDVRGISHILKCRSHSTLSTLKFSSNLVIVDTECQWALCRKTEKRPRRERATWRTCGVDCVRDVRISKIMVVAHHEFTTTRVVKSLKSWIILKDPA